MKSLNTYKIKKQVTAFVRPQRPHTQELIVGSGVNPAPTTNDFKKINTIPQGAKELTSEAKFKLWVFKCGQGY